MVSLDHLDSSNKYNIDTRHRRSPNMLVKLGALMAAGTLIGGVAEMSQHHGRVNQAEVVKPYDTAWDLVRRADKDAGIDPDSVDMRPAVSRVVEQYGTNLQPGEKIVVKLDK